MKYVNDKGQVAVLVSSGFGAGWSTWNNIPNSATDIEAIKLHLAYTNQEMEADEVSEELNKLYGDIYTNGFFKCHIEWLKPGTKYTIEEYDGSESLITEDDMGWMIA